VSAGIVKPEKRKFGISTIRWFNSLAIQRVFDLQKRFQPVEQRDLRIFDFLAGGIYGEISGAINFGKTLELAGIGRPLHGISAALNGSLALPIVFNAPGMHDFATLLPD